MTTGLDRKRFLKYMTAGAVGGAAFAAGMDAPGAGGGGARVTVWDGPGGGIEPSPDYEVAVRAAGQTWKPFTYYSYNRPYDKTLDVEGHYVKLSFLGLHSNEYRRPEANKDTYAHSWTHFDFAGGPVEVEVKIRRPFVGLSLPLRSCRIFPSTLGLDCEVTGGDTIRFVLDRPCKIAIVPNYLQAVEMLEKTENKQAFEGYRNPLFLFARAPETDPPDKNASGTLLIRPGADYGPDDFARAKVIYFEPGVHDYSRFNPADPDHYIMLKTGQTMYLAGGAYVYGHIASEIKGPIADMPMLRGRGTMSGFKQRWTDFPYKSCEEKNVRMEGIHITDAHNHISHSVAPVRDIAVVGAWHGNTDGITRHVPKEEPYDGWHIDDCFVMAGDTNLKLGGCGRARNVTLWQLSNAEPIWMARPEGGIADGVHVIAFNKWPSLGQSVPGQVLNFHQGAGKAKDFVVRNLTVDAPFVPRLFYIPADVTGNGQAYENVLFENIAVHTPHIRMKSSYGGKSPKTTAVGKVVFRNLVVNGKRITADNCGDYFEFMHGVTVGKEIIFE